MSFQQAVPSTPRIERAVDVEERVAFIHCGPVTANGRNGPILQQIRHIEQLLKGQPVLLAMLGVRRDVVQFSES